MDSNQGELSARECADGSMKITARGSEKWVLAQAPVRYDEREVLRDARGTATATWTVWPEGGPVKGGGGGGGGGKHVVIAAAELEDSGAKWFPHGLVITPSVPGNLTPAELRRIRAYHAALLGRPVEQLERDGIGEARWTRRDLVAVDAVLAARSRRDTIRAALVLAAISASSLVAGGAVAWFAW